MLIKNKREYSTIIEIYYSARPKREQDIIKKSEWDSKPHRRPLKVITLTKNVHSLEMSASEEKS